MLDETDCGDMERHQLPPLLTLRQAATLLRLDADDVRRAATAGELPTVEVDHDLLVPTETMLSQFGVPENARLVGRHKHSNNEEN